MSDNKVEKEKKPDKASYRDDYEMLSQIVSGSPHLKRIVLEKLRVLKTRFHESAFDQANRKEKEDKDGGGKKRK